MSATTMEGVRDLRAPDPLDVIRDSLAKITEPGRPVLSIVRRAFEITGIEAETILSPSREPAVCWVRFAVVLAAHRAQLSYAQIGRTLRRDHSTIMHAANRARELMQADDGFAALVEVLTP